MKNIFMAAIHKGGYDLNTMIQRIDKYHIEGKLTDEEREDLLSAARGDAIPGLNANDEIQKLWAAIRALQDEVNTLKNGDAPDSGETPAEVKEYTQPTGAHDAYYAGAQVSYNGKVYKCIAPAGVACVWSPDVMPGYWEAV